MGEAKLRASHLSDADLLHTYTLTGAVLLLVGAVLWFTLGIFFPINLIMCLGATASALWGFNTLGRINDKKYEDARGSLQTLGLLGLPFGMIIAGLFFLLAHSKLAEVVEKPAQPLEIVPPAPRPPSTPVPAVPPPPSVEVLYCTSCGLQIPTDTKYCPYCGEKRSFPFDEVIYRYIKRHKGVISISQAAADLESTMEEVNASIKRLRKEGKIE